MKIRKHFILVLISSFIFSVQSLTAQYTGGHDYQAKYFLSEPAFNLESGSIQYSNIMLFYNDINIGVSDHLSVGLSGIALGFFVGADVPASLRIKFSQSMGNKLIHMGGGLRLNTWLDYKTLKNDGFTYEPFGIFTFGNGRNNIGFEFSIPYEHSIWDKPNYKLNGKVRITKRTAVMGEIFYRRDNNYNEYMSLVGGQTYFKKWALEYGAFMVGNNDESHLPPVWPFIGAKFYLN